MFTNRACDDDSRMDPLLAFASIAATVDAHLLTGYARAARIAVTRDLIESWLRLKVVNFSSGFCSGRIRSLRVMGEPLG